MHIVWYWKQFLYLSKAFSCIPPGYFDGNYVTSQFHTINIIITAHPSLYNIAKIFRKKAVVCDGVNFFSELLLKAPVLTVP